MQIKLYWYDDFVANIDTKIPIMSHNAENQLPGKCDVFYGAFHSYPRWLPSQISQYCAFNNFLMRARTKYFEIVTFLLNNSHLLVIFIRTVWMFDRNKIIF